MKKLSFSFSEDSIYVHQLSATSKVDQLVFDYPDIISFNAKTRYPITRFYSLKQCMDDFMDLFRHLAALKGLIIDGIAVNIEGALNEAVPKSGRRNIFNRLDMIVTIETEASLTELMQIVDQVKEEKQTGRLLYDTFPAVYQQHSIIHLN